MSGALLAACSTVGPAGAAKSEQVSLKFFSSIFSPMYLVSAVVGHRLSIDSFGHCTLPLRPCA